MKRMICAVLVWTLALQASAEDAPRADLPPVQAAPEAALPPHLAFANSSDPNPGSGRIARLIGWIAAGVGLAGVAQAPLCRMQEFTEPSQQRSCRNSSIVLGTVGFGLGLPLLIVGYRKRRAQRAWKERHGLGELAPSLRVDRDSIVFGLRF